MQLYILRSDVLRTIKSKKYIEDNLNKFQKYKDSSWIKEEFGDDAFLPTYYENVPDVELSIDPDLSTSENIYFNAVKLHSALISLSPSDATDERLWAALALGPFFNFIQQNVELENYNNVVNAFFYKFQVRRSIIRHPIAQLWWIPHLTYNEHPVHNEDPYTLTKQVCDKKSFIFNLLERNYSNNRKITRAYLKAIIEGNENGYNFNNGDDIATMSKYLSTLAGAYVLEYKKEDWIQNKLLDKLKEIGETNDRIALEKRELKVEEKEQNKFRII